MEGWDPSTLRPIAEALGYCADPQRLDDVECERRLTHGSAAWKHVKVLVHHDPFWSSAEFNVMRYFIDYDGGSYGVRMVDEVVLYHTDTHAGRVSADVIKGFLEGVCGVIVSARETPGLGVF